MDDDDDEKVVSQNLLPDTTQHVVSARRRPLSMSEDSRIPILRAFLKYRLYSLLVTSNHTCHLHHVQTNTSQQHCYLYFSSSNSVRGHPALLHPVQCSGISRMPGQRMAMFGAEAWRRACLDPIPSIESTRTCCAQHWMSCLLICRVHWMRSVTRRTTRECTFQDARAPPAMQCLSVHMSVKSFIVPRTNPWRVCCTGTRKQSASRPRRRSVVGDARAVHVSLHRGAASQPSSPSAAPSVLVSVLPRACLSRWSSHVCTAVLLGTTA
jgi:hypothetical protein